MSIHPIAFAADGGITIFHDEANHGGDIAFADITFGRNVDNTIDIGYIVLVCPFVGCGAVTIHPMGGGSHPGLVQKLFVRTLRRRAAALLPVGQRSLAAILVLTKNKIEQVDGVGRFRLENMVSEDDEPTK